MYLLLERTLNQKSPGRKHDCFCSCLDWTGVVMLFNLLLFESIITKINRWEKKQLWNTILAKKSFTSMETGFNNNLVHITKVKLIHGQVVIVQFSSPEKMLPWRRRWPTKSSAGSKRELNWWQLCRSSTGGRVGSFWKMIIRSQNHRMTTRL